MLRVIVLVSVVVALCFHGTGKYKLCSTTIRGLRLGTLVQRTGSRAVFFDKSMKFLSRLQVYFQMWIEARWI